MIRKQPLSDENTAITFSLPADHPHAPVSVVGDFNTWMPGLNPLKQRPDGSMSTTIVVPAGVCVRFRYLGRDGAWFDDQDADQLDHLGGLVWG